MDLLLARGEITRVCACMAGFFEYRGDYTNPVYNGSHMERPLAFSTITFYAIKIKKQSGERIPCL